jgi:hypothetical protein
VPGGHDPIDETAGRFAVPVDHVLAGRDAYVFPSELVTELIDERKEEAPVSGKIGGLPRHGEGILTDVLVLPTSHESVFRSLRNENGLLRCESSMPLRPSTILQAAKIGVSLPIYQASTLIGASQAGALIESTSLHTSALVHRKRVFVSTVP